MSARDVDYNPVMKFGFPSRVTQIDVHHRLKLVAAADESNTVKVYGRPGKVMEFRLRRGAPKVPRERIEFLSFQQSGEERLLVITGDGFLEQWDVRTGNTLFEVSLAEAWQVSPTAFWRLQKYNGRFVLVGCDDNTVRVFDTKNVAAGSPIVERVVSDCEVLAIEGSPVDPKYLLVGYANGRVMVWDLETSKNLLERSGCRNIGAGVFAVAWREDGEVFASCGDDGYLVIHGFNPSKKKGGNDLPLAVVEIGKLFPGDKISSISLNWLVSESSDPNDFGDLLAVANFENTTKNINAWVSGITFEKIESPPSYVIDEDASASVGFMYLIKSDEKNPETGHAYMILGTPNAILIKHPSFGETNVPIDQSNLLQRSVFSKIINDDGSGNLAGLIAALCKWRTTQTRVPSSEDLCSHNEWPVCGGEPLSTAVYSPAIIISCLGNDVQFWDISTPLVMSLIAKFSLSGENADVCILDFCLTTKSLAVGFTSGDIYVYNLLPINEEEKGRDPLVKLVFKVQGNHVSRIVSLCVNGSMKRLASGDEDGMVSLIDLASGETVLHEGLNLTSDVDFENAVSFASSLQLTKNHFPQTEDLAPCVLFCGSSDGRLRVHNAITGAFLSSFKMAIRDTIVFTRSLSQVGKPVRFVARSLDNSSRSPVRPTSSRCFLLVCCGSQVYLFSEKLEAVASVSIDTSITCAEVISDPRQSDDVSYALMCIDKNGIMYVFELMTLEKILEVDVKCLGTKVISTSGLICRSHPDGRVESAVVFSEISRQFQKERRPSSFFPSEPSILPVDIPIITPLTKFVVTAVPKTLKKQKSFFSSLISVLPLGSKDALHDRLNDSVSNRSLLGLGPLKSLFESNESKELPVDPMKLSKSQSHPGEDIAPSRSPAMRKTSSDTRNVMANNVEKASRNLDKLKQMEDKSDKMKNEAQDFFEAAKQLRKQNEGWF
eukprot:TRINITY_DN5901_c0_g1_i1.p1 TRINITY_DN5901_c0_g1~~TRINITY_DN5901_c0_g1_i1.p1  ORF type:complete len:977 (+),score=242.38 TRINITY_DN5901_c0_g1_i1:97-2931(+)